MHHDFTAVWMAPAVDIWPPPAEQCLSYFGNSYPPRSVTPHAHRLCACSLLGISFHLSTVDCTQQCPADWPKQALLHTDDQGHRIDWRCMHSKIMARCRRCNAKCLQPRDRQLEKYAIDAYVAWVIVNCNRWQLGHWSDGQFTITQAT